MFKTYKTRLIRLKQHIDQKDNFYEREVARTFYDRTLEKAQQELSDSEFTRLISQIGPPPNTEYQTLGEREALWQDILEARKRFRVNIIV